MINTVDNSSFKIKVVSAKEAKKHKNDTMTNTIQATSVWKGLQEVKSSDGKRVFTDNEIWKIERELKKENKNYNPTKVRDNTEIDISKAIKKAGLAAKFSQLTKPAEASEEKIENVPQPKSSIDIEAEKRGVTPEEQSAPHETAQWVDDAMNKNAEIAKQFKDISVKAAPEAPAEYIEDEPAPTNLKMPKFGQATVPAPAVNYPTIEIDTTQPVDVNPQELPTPASETSAKPENSAISTTDSITEEINRDTMLKNDLLFNFKPAIDINKPISKGHLFAETNGGKVTQKTVKSAAPVKTEDDNVIPLATDEDITASYRELATAIKSGDNETVNNLVTDLIFFKENGVDIQPKSIRTAETEDTYGKTFATVDDINKLYSDITNGDEKTRKDALKQLKDLAEIDVDISPDNDTAAINTLLNKINEYKKAFDESCSYIPKPGADNTPVENLNSAFAEVQSYLTKLINKKLASTTSPEKQEELKALLEKVDSGNYNRDFIEEVKNLLG